MPAKPEPEPAAPEAVILLVTASWCLPCRPARTLLRELQGRWGEEFLGLILEDASDALLDELRVDQVPTWISLVPESSPAQTHSTTGATGTAGDDGSSTHSRPDDDGESGQQPAVEPQHPVETHAGLDEPVGEQAPPARVSVTDLEGEDAFGRPVTLSGTWLEVGRRQGAAPKLEIDAAVRAARGENPAH